MSRASASARFTLRAPGPWERNLYVLWLAQATSALGLSFLFPFLPLFIQQLGVEDPGEAALWTGIAGGVGGLFMMLSGPIWGILGDRYGRKKNVLRAMFGSAIVLLLTAAVTDVYQLVALRIMLGLVSGTWVTVMALVAAITPKHKIAYSIGVVGSATFLGLTLGPLVGGLLVDSFGFRPTFVITSIMAASAGILVLLFVKDGFARAEHGREKQGPRLIVGDFLQLVRSRHLGPVLLVVFLVQVGPSMVMPALPVFVGALANSGSVAFSTGVAFSIMGIAGAASSLVMSRLSRKLGIMPVLVVAFIGGGLLYLPLTFATNLGQVYAVMGLLGFFTGGLVTVSFALVGTSVSTGKQGSAYGAAQSAMALAGGIGPLMGGAIAVVWGVGEVFLVTSVVMLLTGALVMRLLGERQAEPSPEALDSEPLAHAEGDD